MRALSLAFLFCLSLTAAEVEVTFLHMNDVYELVPINDYGGLARVAGLLRALERENPNTYAVLAGDLLSPSAVGLAKVDGEALAGKQMIATLNVLGLDLMVLGNHEFDLKEAQLRARIAESAFTWSTANVFESDGKPFAGVKPYHTMTVKGEGGAVKIGFFSVCLDQAKVDWVRYDNDYTKVARQQVDILRNREKVDVVIGVTHLAASDDVGLVEAVPGIDIIMGGHEHENMLLFRGPDLVPIAKADANARTVYIHDLTWDTEQKTLAIASRLKVIDNTVPEDAETAAEAEKWTEIAFSAFREQGVDPDEAVAVTPIPLDGLEASIRNGQTDLTEIFAAGLANSEPDVTIGIFNAGSIRIDDIIPAGSQVTEYDVLRILPFGGTAVIADVKGSLLAQILDTGRANAGNGGFLQSSGVRRAGKGYRVGDGALDVAETYRVAFSDYLLTGMEANMSYLTPSNPDLTVVRTGKDLREILAAELKRRFTE